MEDIEVINLELALTDLAQIEKRLERLRKGGASFEGWDRGCGVYIG